MLKVSSVTVIGVTILSGALAMHAQTGAKNGEWRTYGGDLGNTRYSPLDQINAANFDKLRIAWRFQTANLGPRPEFNFEATPLMIGGVVYTVAGSRRDVVALDATNGEILWLHTEKEGPRGDAAPRRLSGRGLAYWTNGREERILYVTPGYRLKALDAKTGHSIPNFGNGGAVDLKLEDDQQIDLVTGEVGLLRTNGEPFDVFPVNAGQAGADGSILQKRDRLSYAILNQISGEYRGEFMDKRLVLTAGLRMPFFKRDLTNNCVTSSAGGFVECFGNFNSSLGIGV